MREVKSSTISGFTIIKPFLLGGNMTLTAYSSVILKILNYSSGDSVNSLNVLSLKVFLA